jgi:uncharacterized protein with von Willebrand factor type A (vWA) domain
MAMPELTERYGAIYYYEHNEVPGLLRLKQIAEHFTHCVWINPTEPYYWNHSTVLVVEKLFPMFELTLDGLGQAVKKLVVKK